MPYRSTTNPSHDHDDEPSHDRAVLLVSALVWLASTARVVFAIVRHETFGAIATCALAFVVILPVMALRRLVQSRSSRA